MDVSTVLSRRFHLYPEIDDSDSDESGDDDYIPDLDKAQDEEISTRHKKEQTEREAADAAAYVVSQENALAVTTDPDDYLDLQVSLNDARANLRTRSTIATVMTSRWLNACKVLGRVYTEIETDARLEPDQSKKMVLASKLQTMEIDINRIRLVTQPLPDLPVTQVEQVNSDTSDSERDEDYDDNDDDSEFASSLSYTTRYRDELIDATREYNSLLSKLRDDPLDEDTRTDTLHALCMIMCNYGVIAGPRGRLLESDVSDIDELELMFLDSLSVNPDSHPFVNYTFGVTTDTESTLLLLSLALALSS